MVDSSTGGYLSPIDLPAPLDDAALEAALQTMIVGISGYTSDQVLALPADLAALPDLTANFCCFALGAFSADDSPSITHHPEDDGTDIYTRHEVFDVNCRFYGPNACEYARRLRDGLGVPQNREPLQKNDFAFVRTSDMTPAHEMLNGHWTRRFDMSICLRRKITRVYAVRNLLSSDISIETE